jgi:hypothetical protein
MIKINYINSYGIKLNTMNKEKINNLLNIVK